MSAERTDALSMPNTPDAVEYPATASGYIDDIESALGDRHFERFLRLSPEGRQIAFSTASKNAVEKASKADLMLIGSYIQWFSQGGAIKQVAQQNGVSASKLRSLVNRMPEMLARFYADRVSIASISLHETVSTVFSEPKPIDNAELPADTETALETEEVETRLGEIVEQDDGGIAKSSYFPLVPKLIRLDPRPSSPSAHPHLPKRSYLQPEPVAPPPIDQQNWPMHALCKDEDPAIFFPDKENQETTRQAKEICRHCPAIEFCYEEEIQKKDQHGIRAALSSRERRAIKKRELKGV